GLVNLCFQALGVAGSEVEPRKERRGTRKVTFRLCDSRLLHQGISVVRCNVKNFIRPSQRFGETTTTDVVSRVLREEINIARVELLGFLEVRLAPVPLASSPCDISQQFRNPAAIR